MSLEALATSLMLRAATTEGESPAVDYTAAQPISTPRGYALGHLVLVCKCYHERNGRTSSRISDNHPAYIIKHYLPSANI